MQLNLERKLYKLIYLPAGTEQTCIHTLYLMWSIYEITQICTAVIDECEDSIISSLLKLSSEEYFQRIMLAHGNFCQFVNRG